MVSASVFIFIINPANDCFNDIKGLKGITAKFHL